MEGVIDMSDSGFKGVKISNLDEISWLSASKNNGHGENE